MGGNKSGVNTRRWALLRALFEAHGHSLEQLTTISGTKLPLLKVRAQKDGWSAGLCVFGQKEKLDDTMPLISSGDETLGEARQSLYRTLAGASRFLQQALERQIDEKDGEAGNEKALNTEGRVKEIVSITKAVQVLEGLIANMETPKDDASPFPQDTLEFHRLLEKQIENLAKSPGAGAVSQTARPV